MRANKVDANGYVLHRRQFGDEGIYLPPRIAFEFEEQARLEQEAKDSEEVGRREAAEAARRASAKGPQQPVFVAATPVVALGWYRVLPDYDAMVERLAEIERGGVHADREQGKRDVLALRKAAQLGPDRQLCLPDLGVFAELEIELPTFAPAISLLRNALHLAVALLVALFGFRRHP